MISISHFLKYVFPHEKQIITCLARARHKCKLHDSNAKEPAQLPTRTDSNERPPHSNARSSERGLRPRQAHCVPRHTEEGGIGVHEPAIASAAAQGVGRWGRWVGGWLEGWEGFQLQCVKFLSLQLTKCAIYVFWTMLSPHSRFQFHSNWQISNSCFLEDIDPSSRFLETY